MALRSIEFASTGRPMAKCPCCGRLHAVMRRDNYLAKPQLRFQCKNPECGITWRSTSEEREAIIAYYRDRKPRTKAAAAATTPPPKQDNAPPKEDQNRQTGQETKKPAAAWQRIIGGR